MSFILKEKENRIKILLLGKEAIDIYANSEKSYGDFVTEENLLDALNLHILNYVSGTKNEKELINDMTYMSELILN